jgi:hypothetical protein
MGAKYLTADQCHGHRVPMFYRSGPEEQFQESTVCPPSGCLTCGDSAGEAKVPCGSEFLGRANALQDVDYKKQFISLESIRKASSGGA